jgi:hypothetical protein
MKPRTRVLIFLVFLLIVFIFVWACFHRSPSESLNLPINADVRQETISGTICQPGWSKTVRPPNEFMMKIKKKLLAERGEPTDSEHMKLYELDHHINISIGGATRDIKNLQLQLWPEAHEKDRVEVCLKVAVCHGRVSLDDARKAIWNDWHKAAELCKG